MFNENEVVNGLYGRVYDETGAEIQGTSEFEAKVDFEKKGVKQAGKFIEGQKVVGGKGTGKMKISKLDTRLQRKILANPTAKFNYMGKLADPASRGEEAVLLKGVSFNGTTLMAYKLGELVETDFDFTFDDGTYTKWIE